MARILRYFIAAAAVVGLGAAFVLAFRPRPVLVDLAQVVRQPLVVTVDEDARTRVMNKHVVSTPLAGNLQRIALRPGDAVATGAPVAVLTPLPSPLLDPRTRAEAQGRAAAAAAVLKQAEAVVTQAEAALEYASREATRQRQLAASKAVPDSAVELADLQMRRTAGELASARFGARVAAHEAQMARTALGRFGGDAAEQFVIPAPLEGVVLRVFQQSASVVQPGTPLLEIADPAALEIAADVLTADAVSIRPGAKVRILRWGGNGVLKAHVRLVEPQAVTRISALGVEEQRVDVIIDLDEPRERWAALGDGYRVEAEIVTYESPDALTVPLGAIFRHGDGWAAFTVRDGVAHRVPVTTGHRNATGAEILGGLADGDTVVLYPGERVQDGAAVSSR